MTAEKKEIVPVLFSAYFYLDLHPISSLIFSATVMSTVRIFPISALKKIFTLELSLQNSGCKNDYCKPKSQFHPQTFTTASIPQNFQIHLSLGMTQHSHFLIVG